MFSKLMFICCGFSFIRKFVLCPECDNPETDLMVNAKKQTISQACKACGFHGLIEFNHKLNTFILKNPPNAPTGQVKTRLCLDAYKLVELFFSFYELSGIR